MKIPWDNLFTSLTGAIVGAVVVLLGGYIIKLIREKIKWRNYTYVFEMILREQKEAIGLKVCNPEPGSKEWKIAEEMTKEGLLDRAPSGGYCLPGRIRKES